MPPAVQIYRVSEAHSPDSEIIARLAQVFREARCERLQFLIDLHSIEEDRAFLSRVVLPQDQVWVAEVDRSIAGFIAIGEGWVNQLYIAPPFQRRGLGTKLLEIAKQSHLSLQLWVFEVNAPAIAFYERRGFRVVERTDGASNEAKEPDLRMVWNAEQGV